jgi:hypothetical protein
MPPARLGSEKADRVIGDRWTEEGLTAIPFKARPYGVEFVDADGVAQARNSMHFGGAMFFTDYSMSAMELTRALEERGFESIWAPEHSGSVRRLWGMNENFVLVAGRSRWQADGV